MKNILPKSPYIPYITAFVIALLYFFFQFHHIQQYLDFDQIVYCNNILKALKYRTGVMFNAHHLHMEIGGKWFHDAMMHSFEKYGFTDAVFNNRLRSVLFGCIGIFFSVLYLKEMTGKLFWGIIGSILIGFCHGYLSYSSKVDTAIYPAAGMIAILWIFVKIEKTKKWSILLSFVAGIFLFFSVMFHQYMGIACFISVAALALPGWCFPHLSVLKTFFIKTTVSRPEIDRSPKKRYIAAVVMGLVGIILVCGGYFYAGETCYNLPFSKEEKRAWRGPFGGRVFQNWVFGYAVGDTWGHGLEKFNPRNPIYGYTKAFLTSVAKGNKLPSYDGRYYYDLSTPLNKYTLSHNLVAYMTITAILGAVILFPFLWKRYRRSFFLVVTGLVLFSLFTTYWESYYYEFWLIPCLLACVLIILIFNYLAEKLSFLLKRFAWYPFYTLILIFTLFVSFHNIQYHAVPYSRNQVLWGYSKRWDKSYYMDLISDYIYKNPGNPYKDIYSK